jgi:hypothetical protein
MSGDVLTPKEYLSVEGFRAAFTAHRPTTRDMISLSYLRVSIDAEISGEYQELLTIWNASAIRAKEPTATPTPSSRMRNAVSMASMTVIRVDFDHAITKRIWRCV